MGKEETKLFKEAEVLMTPLEKDHFNIHIGMKWIGRFERSQIRYIIQQLDNKL
tara:strand:+ start:554 stop:712 length:159 start_codon:yes stop_codon:yes gene_type:complete